MARRDRHGRGPRSPLVLRAPPPSRTRRGAFETLVISAAVHLEERWGAEWGEIDIAAADFPPQPSLDTDAIPAGDLVPANGEEPARIIIYRRPLEDRSPDGAALAAAVRDTLAEQVGRLVGRPPDEVDPDYGT